MEYPKRVDQHISENESFKVLNNHLPSSWVLREVTGVDYGVDCYIEIVGDDNLLKGEMVSIQLKAVSGIPWTKSDYYTFSGIKVSTTNYWNKSMVPVFVMVADVVSKELFFQPVKSYIRQNFERYNKQDAFTYKIQKANEMTEQTLDVFLEAYFKEKNLSDLETQLVFFMSSYRLYVEYCEQHNNRDQFMGIENSRVIFLKAHYENIEKLCSYFGILWDLKPFKEFQQESIETFDDKHHYTLHELYNDKIVDALEPKLKPILLKIRELITEQEKDYWLINNYPLFTEADSIEDDGSYDGYWD